MGLGVTAIFSKMRGQGGASRQVISIYLVWDNA